MKNRLGILLIAAGILLALFPLGDRIYTWYFQSKALDSYEALDSVFVEELQSEEAALAQTSEQGIQAGLTGSALTGSAVTSSAGATTPAVTKPPAPKPVPIGVLKIDKINLKLPILSGATNGHMKVGVGWIKETTPIGEVGNAALAAHRSYTYGRFFNRLDEVVVGDRFQIEAAGTVYEYEVFQKLVVLPTDTSVLNRNNRDHIVTLITCTPIRKATHRLIIQGKLIEK